MTKWEILQNDAEDHAALLELDQDLNYPEEIAVALTRLNVILLELVDTVAAAAADAAVDRRNSG